jgi:hypothetical protein
LENSLGQDPLIESQGSGKKSYTQKRIPGTQLNSHMEEVIRLNYMGKTVITTRVYGTEWREIKEIRLVSVILSNFVKFIHADSHLNFSFGLGPESYGYSQGNDTGEI